MITLHIEAVDGEDLRTQLHALLGSAATVALAHELIGKATAPARDFVPSPPVNNGDNVTVEGVKTETEQPVTKQRRAHRRTRPLPVEELEAQGSEGSEASVENGEEKSDFEFPDISGDQTPVTEMSSADAQKVKDEVLPKLRDLFVAGRVKEVRAVLDKFGHGAKSIPEIDAAHFPAIKEFLRSAA